MIQTAFNGMIAILLARFMLNAVPHALELLPPPKHNSLEEYERERRAASVRKAVRIVPPTPTRVPGSTLTVERTSVNMKMLDDLEATWHRIESDMSYEMQSALGILKEVMGYRFEQPVVAVYEGSNLMGVAVYETIDDKDLGVRDTNISELASFTRKPGVGRMLVEEVIRIAREENADAVTASYGPGARGFYERLGFVKDYRHPEVRALMMYKLKSGNPGGNPGTAATVYHVTHKDNVDSIMEKGLLASETSSGMLFFFPTLQYARESGLTDMAILAVMLTGEEIDKCEIGEIFPDLYEEKFGGQPPADMSLRSYLEHPVPYGVPEVSCTIVMIPPDRIRQVEVISR